MLFKARRNSGSSHRVIGEVLVLGLLVLVCKIPCSSCIFQSNGQNRVHPEARWPKPGTPFHASPRAPSYWPTPAQTRLWPNLKRVHPILATHPPIGYPISITPTRLWPGYSTSSPHAHASLRHRGTRRVIFAVDVVVRAAEL